MGPYGRQGGKYHHAGTDASRLGKCADLPLKSNGKRSILKQQWAAQLKGAARDKRLETLRGWGFRPVFVPIPSEKPHMLSRVGS